MCMDLIFLFVSCVIIHAHEVVIFFFFFFGGGGGGGEGGGGRIGPGLGPEGNTTH